MLWPKASPLDLDFGLCARAKLFNEANNVKLTAQFIVNVFNLQSKCVNK